MISILTFDFSNGVIWISSFISLNSSDDPSKIISDHFKEIKLRFKKRITLNIFFLFQKLHYFIHSFFRWLHSSIREKKITFLQFHNRTEKKLDRFYRCFFLYYSEVNLPPIYTFFWDQLRGR